MSEMLKSSTYLEFAPDSRKLLFTGYCSKYSCMMLNSNQNANFLIYFKALAKIKFTMIRIFHNCTNRIYIFKTSVYPIISLAAGNFTA